MATWFKTTAADGEPFFVNLDRADCVVFWSDRAHVVYGRDEDDFTPIVIPGELQRLRELMDSLQARKGAQEDQAAFIWSALKTAESAYLALLLSPPNYRFQVQAELVALREFIASASGREAEVVQDDFEARAALAKANGGQE